jgi:hypothetical protein
MRSAKEEATCRLHFAVNIWKAKLQLFSLPPECHLFFFFSAHLNFFVRLPSILQFSAL